ncbi:Alanine racemase [Chionoecetes opilio]|uniref:Alanine racemase n=1 Tax=Chionoecetes opilio TaxID=41210 RepID=A0A8J4YBE3_CHIOP|nr:Alanine racemase [Chionoecetes opilio]
MDRGSLAQHWFQTVRHLVVTKQSLVSAARVPVYLVLSPRHAKLCLLSAVLSPRHAKLCCYVLYKQTRTWKWQIFPPRVWLGSAARGGGGCWRGVEELSVATVAEGVYLRRQGVTRPITVLGNLLDCEVEDVLKHRLIPSISWLCPLTAQPSHSLNYPDGSRLRVAVNLDTGMSRYGVQPQDLPALVTTLDALQVTIHSIYTHFQAAIDEPHKNKRQLDIFLETTEPYKLRPLTRHVAATTGCVQGLGTNLDFIRPGGAITGLCSGSDEESVGLFAKCGFRPALSVVARPTFFKQLPSGRGIGYDATYQTSCDEWIANLTTGWSDGFSRRPQQQRSRQKGELCPIVGRVSMDSITIRLPEPPAEDEVFQVISDDFDENTSAVGLSRILEAAVYEMPGKLDNTTAKGLH